jgi:hypothetical protein
MVPLQVSTALSDASCRFSIQRLSKDICAEVEIEHPYGVVAPLRIESGPGIRFGEINASWIELATNIKTFTEQTVDADGLKAVRTQIQL